MTLRYAIPAAGVLLAVLSPTHANAATCVEVLSQTIGPYTPPPPANRPIGPYTTPYQEVCVL